MLLIERVPSTHDDPQRPAGPAFEGAIFRSDLFLLSQ